ncbi:MAG: alpha/beta hydrolase family protein [Pirellulaceae bacterium]
MLAELVRVTTSDQCRLDGAWYAAPAGTTHPSGVDACLFLHGVAGNFYAGNLFDYLVNELVPQGTSCLRVNTRGHDSVCVAWGKSGTQFQGAAYEIVDQCRFDVRAWVEWLVERGARHIVLLGHSLGAIKAIYSQAYDPHPAVSGVVACSAPRLSYAAFMNSDAQPRFFESVTAAREQLQRGQPEMLILSKFPAAVWMTAAGYLDKYGPDERYNILRFIDRLTCPLLATYGELELSSGGIAFAGMHEAVVDARRDGQRVETAVVAGADHAYTGVYDRLYGALAGFL